MNMEIRKVYEQYSTFGIDSNVHEAAIILILNDTALLAKLSAGDIVALDAMYHLQCPTKLYHTANMFQNSQPMKMFEEENIECIVGLFAELVAHIENARL